MGDVETSTAWSGPGPRARRRVVAELIGKDLKYTRVFLRCVLGWADVEWSEKLEARLARWCVGWPPLRSLKVLEGPPEAPCGAGRVYELGGGLWLN